jgi:hypothetical protein
VTDRRLIHAPEFHRSGEPDPRRGMNRRADRPSCWRAADDGWACAAAATPDLQQDLLAHTPGCSFCARGQRAAMLYWRYAR